MSILDNTNREVRKVSLSQYPSEDRRTELLPDMVRVMTRDVATWRGRNIADNVGAGNALDSFMQVEFGGAYQLTGGFLRHLPKLSEIAAARSESPQPRHAHAPARGR